MKFDTKKYQLYYIHGRRKEYELMHRRMKNILDADLTLIDRKSLCSHD